MEGQAVEALDKRRDRREQSEAYEETDICLWTNKQKDTRADKETCGRTCRDKGMNRQRQRDSYICRDTQTDREREKGRERELLENRRNSKKEDRS